MADTPRVVDVSIFIEAHATGTYADDPMKSLIVIPLRSLDLVAGIMQFQMRVSVYARVYVRTN